MWCPLCASLVVWLLPDAPAMVLVALAVPSAVLAMLATRSFHPPGGATALLAAIAQPKLGFGMVLCPMLAGTVLLVGVRHALDFGVLAVSRRMSELSRASESLASAPRELPLLGELPSLTESLGSLSSDES